MSTKLIQDLHAGISRRDWSSVETAANRLRDEVEKTVALLAGTGIGSLPNDYPLSKLAADLLSEAEKREKEATAKLQAMHRRAQTAEGAFRGVMNVIDLWEPTLKFHKLSTHDIVMRSIKQDFERAVRKASALQSEER